MIYQIEGVLTDNLSFLSDPNVELANNLISGLHSDHKVTFVCGTDCFKDEPVINQLVSNIASEEFMLVKSIRRWLSPKCEIIQKEIYKEIEV